MITLLRQKNEQIVIELPGHRTPITVTVVDVVGDKCWLGFEGDLQNVPVYCREELDAAEQKS